MVINEEKNIMMGKICKVNIKLLLLKILNILLEIKLLNINEILLLL